MGERANKDLIDPVDNLVNKPVFLLSGTDDTWVYQSVMRGVATQFQNLSARVKTVFNLSAAHSWVVDDQTCIPQRTGHQFEKQACCVWKNDSTACPLPPDAQAVSTDGCCGICQAGDADDSGVGIHNKCSVGWRPPIVNCQYDMAGEVLKWILGSTAIQPRAKMVSTNLFFLEQAKYLPKGATLKNAALDERGLIYVPQQCRHQTPLKCGIHVHYHPCGGSIRQVSTSYFLQNGLPQYAESNDMVIVYPQATSAAIPEGAACFDWNGYTGKDFDTRQGRQLRFVINVMLNLPNLLNDVVTTVV